MASGNTRQTAFKNESGAGRTNGKTKIRTSAEEQWAGVNTGSRAVGRRWERGVTLQGQLLSAAACSPGSLLAVYGQVQQLARSPKTKTHAHARTNITLVLEQQTGRLEPWRQPCRRRENKFSRRSRRGSTRGGRGR